MGFLRVLEGVRAPFLDTLFGLITMLGEETIAIILLCAIYWCINKRMAYGIGVAYFLSGLTAQGMKICFRIDRPWVIDPSFNPVQSAMKTATGYSFPSGHTQSAAALYGSIGVYIKQKWAKIICFLIVFLVAFSRMYLGVHTLLDVSVSIVITFIFIFITYKLLIVDENPTGKKRELFLPILLILFSAAIIIIAALLFSNATIEEAYVTDCLKAAGAGLGFAVGMYVERVYIRFSVKTKGIVWQFIKLVIGIVGVLAFKEGLKLIVGTGLVVDTVRYALLIIWVTILFPLLIKRFVPKNV